MMQSALPVLVSEYRLNVELYTSLFSIYTYIPALSFTSCMYGELSTYREYYCQRH